MRLLSTLKSRGGRRGDGAMVFDKDVAHFASIIFMWTTLCLPFVITSHGPGWPGSFFLNAGKNQSHLFLGHDLSYSSPSIHSPSYFPPFFCSRLRLLGGEEGVSCSLVLVALRCASFSARISFVRLNTAADRFAISNF